MLLVQFVDRGRSVETTIRCFVGKAVAAGAVLASLALMSLWLPGRAGAELITPHAATPATVTPHEVESAPGPAAEPVPGPAAQTAPEPAEAEVEEEASSSTAPRRPGSRKGPGDVPPARGEVPRPNQPDTESAGCGYDCHHTWFDWSIREGGRLIAYAVQLEASLGPGWKFENAIFPALIRAVALDNFKNELAEYLMEHEFEHQLEQILDIAHPWGPAPATAPAPAAAPAGGTGNVADSESGPAGAPCRNGNVADANDEVEDPGSGSAACR